MCIELIRPSPGVAVLTIDNPPVNALSTPFRLALLKNLRKVEADDDVRAVVLTGNAKTFCAGADLKEFTNGTAMYYPSLVDVLIPFILAMSKPLVAAIGGSALGGGLELAMWCHARVATPTAALGLTETTLGLMPGAGGNQLLPRAVGLERAVNLILNGRIQAAESFKGTALIDGFASQDSLIEVAGELALSMAERGRPFAHLSERSVEHPQAAGFLAVARAQTRARKDCTNGMLVALDAIELSLSLPATEGLKREFALFCPVMESDEALAIRHAFFAEREAPKVRDVHASTPAREVRRAAVIGAGFMGSGIAHCLARAGIDVLLHDVSVEAAQRAVAKLAAYPEIEAQRVSVLRELSELAHVDLVIEAVVESMDAKIEVFRKIDPWLRTGALLATNTSTLDVDVLAQATSRAPDVIGLHFFGPAPVMRLLEIVRGAQTSVQAIATSLQLARRMKKVPIVARVGPGFVGNRIFDRLLDAALELAAEGVRPGQVDRALEVMGMKMGPFRTMDLIGNDVLSKARGGRTDTAGYALAEALVGRERFGQKSGRGWYRYGADRRTALADPEVDALLPAAPASALAPTEIVDRCVLAMVNEGAHVLEEGIAQRASDIDIAFLLGYGFPRRLGGPMLHADRSGLAVVEQKLLDLRRRTGNAVWTPAPLVMRLAREGGVFNPS